VGQGPASLELALTEHWLPDAARVWLERFARAVPATVRETANRAEGADLTTYLTGSYALGTASRTYSIGQDDFYIEHQSNYLALHYVRPVREADPGEVRIRGERKSGWGLVYSRYVVNDRHYGALTAAPDRPPNAFYDQGHFAGCQLRNKAIALYALQPQHEEVFSLKTVVVFPAATALEEILVGDRRVRVEELPLPVPEDEWVVVADGAVCVGVRPLRHTCLGREAPVVLERGPNAELWLTAHNYRGPAKRFWDYASLRGAFWRGNLRAGYVLEASERAEHDSAQAFLAHLRRAVVEDVTEVSDDANADADADGVSDAVGKGKALRTVTYRSGGDELSLRFDLWHTRAAGRRLNGREYEPPALESPLAAQGRSGVLRAGGAVLETAAQDVWLVAQELDPAGRFWLCVNPQDRPTPLRLETPLGVVSAASWGVGSVELREAARGATLSVRTLAPLPELRVPDGVEIVYAAHEPRAGVHMEGSDG
jgi:hypothetical protein